MSEERIAVCSICGDLIADGERCKCGIIEIKNNEILGEAWVWRSYLRQRRGDTESQKG